MIEKPNTLAGGLALALLAAAAAAQEADAPSQADVEFFRKDLQAMIASARTGAPMPTSTPEGMAANRRVNRFLHTQIVSGSDWVETAAPTGGAVLAPRSVRVEGTSVKATVRVEAPFPQAADGYAWRSALVPVEIDCLEEDRLRATGFTAFEGQNLSGLRHEEAAATPALTYFLPASMGGPLCNVAVAIELDRRRGTVESDPPPDPQALKDWIDAEIQTGPAWDPPAMAISQPRRPDRNMVFLSKEKTLATSGVVELEAREEFLDPQYTVDGLARSVRYRMTLDCARKTVRSAGRVYYARRNLAGEPLAPASALSSTLRIEDDAVLAPQFEAVCAQQR